MRAPSVRRPRLPPHPIYSPIVANQPILTANSYSAAKLLASDLQAGMDVWPAANTNGPIGLYFGYHSSVGFYDF